jgi:hypothetical protein
MKRLSVFLILITLFVTLEPVQAQSGSDPIPTTVTVRVLAHDAKFIGSSMGGAKVVIREVATDNILAEGQTEGGTGNTTVLVKKPHQRYAQLSEEGDAKYQTTLDLNQPTKVRIEITAPMGYPESAATVTQERWLLPGKDLTGDGIVIDVPGFVLNAETHDTTYHLGKGEQVTVPLTATMVMMCGCPISDGGLWDSEPMEITATAYLNGQPVSTEAMTYTGEMNTFSADLPLTQPGTYTIYITAFDTRSSNTAVDKLEVTVSK